MIISGDGSITKVKGSRDKWSVRVYSERDSISGKRHEYKRTVTGSKDDARRVRDALVKSLNEGGYARDTENEGAWVLTVLGKPDVLTGEQVEYRRRVFCDEGSVAQEYQDFKEELTDRNKGIQPTITLSRYFEKWVPTQRNKVQPNTLSTYETLFHTHVEPLIGDYQLPSITPGVIDSWKQAARDHGGRDGEGSSERCTQASFKLLRHVLKQAVRDRLIDFNPCDSCDAPRVTSRPVRGALSQDDARRMLTVLDGMEASDFDLDATDENDRLVSAQLARRERSHEPTRNGKQRSREIKTSARYAPRYLQGQAQNQAFVIGVRLGLSTGMRRGEVLGLTWGSVDLDRMELSVENNAVSVSRARSIESRSVIEKDPKTKAGIRKIAIDRDLSDRLARWKGLQARYLEDMLGVSQSDDTHVVTNVDGGVMDPKKFYHLFRQFAIENDFRSSTGNIVCFHELRHTQATILLSEGMPIKEVQTRLGHESAIVTLDMYAHAIPAQDREAADLFGRMTAR